VVIGFLGLCGMVCAIFILSRRVLISFLIKTLEGEINFGKEAGPGGSFQLREPDYLLRLLDAI
jgi:hypothetical protein